MNHCLVVDFVSGKSRCTVEAEEDNKQKRFNLKPGNLLLDPGTVAVAMGLTGAPELNGRKGFVLGWDEAKQRYVAAGGGGPSWLLPSRPTASPK